MPSERSAPHRASQREDVAGLTPDAGHTPPPAVARVAGLWLYPVKGLGGVALAHGTIGARGLEAGGVGDRRHALVDADGRVVTQREEPRLALARLTLAGATAASGGFTVEAPGQPPLVVGTPRAGGARRVVRVFDDVTAGVAHPPDVDAWFATWLGMPYRLVHMPDDVHRTVDPRYAAPGDHTGYADAYPVLVASLRSLDALNARLAAAGERTVPMDRFRPNLVLETDAPAFAEDGWTELRVGGRPGAALALVKPCARCVVTTIDQTTGARGTEPLRTLSRFRRVGSKVLFGQNAVVRAPGRVRVGDVATPGLVA